MAMPERNYDTDTTKIVVDWQSISSPEDGNSEVNSYSLEYDLGTKQNRWSVLTGVPTDFLSQTFEVTEGILRGGTYNFRLRAKNIWGWGVYS